MRQFLKSFTEQLETDLRQYKSDFPSTYPFRNTMLDNIRYHRVLTEDSSGDPKDYLLVQSSGQTKNRFNVINYNAVIYIVYVKNDLSPFYEFTVICKGIDDVIKNMLGQTIDSFKLCEINRLTGVNPVERDNKSYYCEIGYNFIVDVATTPDDEIYIV